jgi:DNA (cytosine-5)-methyltransferase 1
MSPDTGALSSAPGPYPGERSNRPRLLDLFCGQGGAAMGYARAGFEVVGVDIKPQPRYPFEFYQADALEILNHGPAIGHMPRLPRQFDAIHASPPCKRFTLTGWAMGQRGPGQRLPQSRHEDLLTPTRERLKAIGVPFVIENVPGSPMRPDVVLCGSAFGLEVRRHRWFECSRPIPPLTLACNHAQSIYSVYGHPKHKFRGDFRSEHPSNTGTAADWARAMGIDWMDTDGLSQAIPPAYTEFIGKLLVAYLTDRPLAATGS